MFNPPDPTDLLPDVAEAVAHFGQFHPRFVSWLAQKLSQHWHENPDRLLPREYQQAIVDHALCDFPNAVHALELITRRAVERWRLAREYSRCRKDLAGQITASAVEIVTRPPRVCCDHARALSGVVFTKAQQLPTLPLAACELDFCGCDYRTISHYEFENHLRAAEGTSDSLAPVKGES